MCWKQLADLSEHCSSESVSVSYLSCLSFNVSLIKSSQNSAFSPFLVLRFCYSLSSWLRAEFRRRFTLIVYCMWMWSKDDPREAWPARGVVQTARWTPTRCHSWWVHPYSCKSAVQSSKSADRRYRRFSPQHPLKKQRMVSPSHCRENKGLKTSLQYTIKCRIVELNSQNDESWVNPLM